MEALFYACTAAVAATIVSLVIYARSSKRRYEIENFHFMLTLEKHKTEAAQRTWRQRQREKKRQAA